MPPPVGDVCGKPFTCSTRMSFSENLIKHPRAPSPPALRFRPCAKRSFRMGGADDHAFGTEPVGDTVRNRRKVQGGAGFFNRLPLLETVYRSKRSGSPKNRLRLISGRRMLRSLPHAMKIYVQNLTHTTVFQILNYRKGYHA